MQGMVTVRRWAGLLALTLVVLPCSGAHAAGLSIAVAGDTARLSFSEYQGLTIDLKPYAGAAVITRASILSAQDRGSLVYVLLSVSGPTRKNGGSGFCGAGEESDLVWLKLSGPQIIDARTVLYESCAFSIEALNLPTAVKGAWLLEYDAYSEMRPFVLKYDDRVPEAGVTVTFRPIPR